MKLLRCHIDNFGCLHECDFNFSSGMTVINEANGFGKTTLAAFIEAMFYGLSSSGRDLNKNNRKKYSPWQGGSFGGWLEFETKGAGYRIVRKFGAKTAAGDSFALYESGSMQKSDAFTRNIGEELFGLEETSFRRSTFMPQEHGSLELSSADIQSKLSNLVEDTNDINNLDMAVDALQNARKQFLYYKGTGGTVSSKSDMISELQLQREQAELKRRQLPEKRAELAELNVRISDLSSAVEEKNNEIHRAAKAAADAALSREKREKLRTVTALKSETEALLAQYPFGLPETAEADEADSIFERLLQLDAAAAADDAFISAKQTVEKSHQRFKDGFPCSSDFSKMRRKLSLCAEKRAEHKAACLSPVEEDELNKLRDFFSCGTVTADELDLCDASTRAIRSAENRIIAEKLTDSEQHKKDGLLSFFGGCETSLEEISDYRSKSIRIHRLKNENIELRTHTEIPKPVISKAVVPLLAAGAALLAAGIVLLILKHSVGGAVCAAAGLAGVFAAGFVYLNNRTGHPAVPVITADAQAAIAENQETISLLESETADFLGRYFDEYESRRNAFDELEQNFRALCDIQEKELAHKECRAHLTEQLESEKAALNSVLGRYFDELSEPEDKLNLLRLKSSQLAMLQEKSQQLEEKRRSIDAELHEQQSLLAGQLAVYSDAPPDDLSDALGELEQAAKDYADALRTVNAFEDRIKEIELEKSEYTKKAKAFFEKYAPHLPRERKSLQAIYSDKDRLDDLARRTDEANTAYLDFIASHGDIPDDAPEPDKSLPDILKSEEKELRSQLAELQRTLTGLEHEASLLQSEADTVSPLDDRIESLKLSRDEDMHTAELLDKTVSLLTRASESLTERYLGGLRSGFDDYISCIEPDISGFIVDNNLAVTQEAWGEPREMAFLSAGYGDIVAICMRLALVDALFTDEPSFLILDDPFVNLDDEHMDRSIELLRQISTSHQIIYLTCHSSRDIPSVTDRSER